MDPSSLPAMAPPAGVTPNFADPPNKNGIAQSALIFMMVISTLCVMLRAYSKVYLTKKVHLEDFMILCAYGSYWGCDYASYALVYYPGYFVHMWDLHVRDVTKALYFVYVFGVFYSVVLAMIKVAILVEWCRVFVPAGKRRKSWFWLGSTAVIVLQLCFMIAAIFLLSFQCLPREAIWDQTIPEDKKTCLPLNPLQLLSASVHIVSDVAIFLLPQRIIWSLNMSLEKKLGVAVVFGLGAFAVICSVLRLTATISFGKTPDAMYGIGPVVLWATGEMTCGFFVVCMPTLPRALKESRWLRKLGRKLSSKPTTGDTSGQKKSYNTGSAVSYKVSRASRTNDAYLQLDEDGVPLRGLKPSDSAKDDRDTDRIVRTTEITVTCGGGSARGGDEWDTRK